jgi:hypothetical protein
MVDLRNFLKDLSVGQAIAWRRIRIIPLRLRTMTDVEYLTLDDSTPETPITIEETSSTGSVPELRVRNRATCRVFIPEGSTLIGAKQNRVVNLSVMLAPESVTLIPVSCVERGRWQFQAHQFTPSYFADSPLRAKMSAGATASLRRTGAVHVDQGVVWDHVEDMLDGAKAASPTHAYHAVYDKLGEDLAEYKAQLSAPENATGVAVEIDGMLEAVDLFEKPSVLQKLWPRLVNSYTLAAICSTTPKGKRVDVKGFLEQVLQTPGESYQTVGVGTCVRFTHAEAVGGALFCDGSLVHLSLFANGAQNSAPRETPLTEHGSGMSTVPHNQSKRRRPWWKLWT